MSRRSTRRTAAQQRSNRSSHPRFSTARQLRRQLRLEPLEDRHLLAITVTTLADTVDLNDGLTSLREAIFAANTVPGADTIDFDPALTANGPGTILLKQGELRITDSLTINGPGADLLTIDASGNDPTPDVNNGDGSRILNAWPTGLSQLAAPPSLNVSQLTFTGGDVRGSGGAIQTAGDIRVIASKFVDNVALGSGGAISVRVPSGVQDDSSLHTEIINCQFVRNVARVGNGGAIAIEDNAFFETSTAFVSGSVFFENEAGADGGGVYIAGRMQSIGFTASTFQGDVATNGGGSFIQSYGDLVIDACELLQNRARNAGGGISAGTSHVTIKDTLVHGNFAGEYGGGLNLGNDAEIINSTISNNVGEVRPTWGLAGGGGIAASHDLVLRHSTVTGNLGGGVVAGNVFVDHSIVAKNDSQSFVGPFDVWASVTLRNSLLGSNQLAQIIDLGGSLIGTATDPIDPLLGPLADNSGPTKTHALLPGSPAINAGDLDAAAGQGGVPEFDQRGEPFGRIVGGRIDIGAFEYQTPTDLNLLVDTLADESDGDYSRGDLSLREAIELVNQNRFAGVTDTIHFDPALTATGPATILLTKGELKITDSLTINGPGADLLTIDASGNDPSPEVNDRKGSRVFMVDDGAAAILTTNTISGLRLTGGDIYDSGGAIFSSENLTISTSVVTGNAIMGDSQGYGGGVFVWRKQGSAAPRLVVQGSEISGNVTNRNGGGVAVHGGDLEISSSTIDGNTAGEQGGGVWDRGGTLILNDSKLYSNIAIWGAALHRRGGPTSITASVIEENQGQWTGAIDNESGKLAIWDSSISYNLAGIGSGGAIYSRFDAIQINESLLRGNIALRDGGGIYGSAVIADSEISGNDAGGGGGGIFTDSLRISGSLIHDNTAGAGGGIYSYSGELSVLNCTISNNTGGTGGGVYRISTDIDTTIRSSTIYDNRAQTGAGIFVATRHDTVMDVEYSSVLGNLA